LHPVIRIVSFLVFTASLAVAGATEVWLAAGILGLLYLVLYLARGFAGLASAWRMARRLRWFFLSLLILYFWFTPGQPVPGFLPLPSAWLPTQEGLTEGVLRIAALLSVIFAANLLLCSTGRDDLVAAICWLARPLQWAGLSAERLAVRMILVMEALATVQGQVRGALSQWREEGGPRLRRLGGFSTAVFLQVNAAAEAAPSRTFVLSRCHAPPLYQWLYPGLLALALAG